MTWPLDDKFRIAANTEILAFIARQQPSAHSDIASVLTDSMAGLTGARHYCPDPRGYAYVVLHTAANRIFAIAFGMSSIAFRLPPETASTERSDRLRPCLEIGADWFLAEPARAAIDLAAHCKAAYRLASIAP